jgi:hypothetical protein
MGPCSSEEEVRLLVVNASFEEEVARFMLCVMPFLGQNC